MSEHSFFDHEAACSRSHKAQEEQEFNLFAMLKPQLKRDGNQWSVLYGEDHQGGIIAGFGDSPYAAIMDFNSQWYKKIE